MPFSTKDVLERKHSTSKDIQRATGLSQSSVVRQIKEMGDSVIRYREGRSIVYASTCNAFNSNDKLPLGIVDKWGNVSLIAYIRPLNSGGFFVEPISNIFSPLLGVNKNGLYDDLPYFLYDLRPQGFLGRQLAQKIAVQSDDFPPDPNRWTTNHIGRYLISNGDDLPGNIIFGEQAMLRVKHKPTIALEENYPLLADDVMKGDVPGSSAGGEQPKFTAFSGKFSSHVIVKFSPEGESEGAKRWRDILITEHYASEMINSCIIPAAETRLFKMKKRLFLETQRFDRLERFGRSSMISLNVIDREYVGLGSNWPKVMKKLFDKGMVKEQDVLDSESLWLFGRLINNTDMHLGNLSLSIENDSFRLLPVYDMCSMGFAPKRNGEILPFSFEVPYIQKANIDEEQMKTVIKTAYDFWEKVSNDDRISSPFGEFLQQGNPVDSLLSDFSPSLRP